MLARVLAAAAILALAVTLAACGGDDDTGRATELRWFIFNEPGGGPEAAAKRCSDQSDGRYSIRFEYLPADADGQREQLVRRLGAEDESIDLIGMDIIWTGEFANAGWIEPVPEDKVDAFSENVFESVLDAARFEDRLYAAPIWTNTQLLWYRSDRVEAAPQTWDEMIDKAEEIGPQGRIQVQANRYEGYTVWANAMIESAGASVISPAAEEGEDDEVSLEQGPTERALAAMGRLGNSTAAAPGIDTSEEDSGRQAFQDGNSTFMVNYPFVYPSAEAEAPEVFENMEAAKYPRVDPERESAPPLGGINIGVSSFSRNSDVAWEAAECLVEAENQIAIAKTGGLPPVREDLYERAEIQEIYPGFADVLRESIQTAAPRPSQSPAYQDLSLGIQRALHSVTDIDPDDPTPAYERLRDRVQQAIAREGLL
jgi:multiple sugar transport system substrate-binding protein